jgi:cytochrome P450
MNERMPPPAAATAPPPPTTPLWYGLRDYQRDSLGFLEHLIERYGDVVRWRTPITIHIINHPDDVKRVLSAPSERFSKQTIDYRILSRSLGQGLVTSDGPAWARQRKLMQPMFHNRAINPFDAQIDRLTNALAARWARLPPGEVVALDDAMGRLTFEVVGATLFGVDVEPLAREIGEILDVINISTHELRALLTLVPWLPTPHNRRSRAAIARLDAIVYGLIEARRSGGGHRDDILDRLLAARDEDDGAGMSEKQIRDEVVTLLLAGHETSSNALLWTFQLLSAHPEVEARLLGELDRELGTAPATSADLARLPYLKQVVQESMRIRPPVWAIARRSHQDEIFQGYRVEAGAYLMIMPWMLHRHRDFWPEPLVFDPERFSPKRTEARHSYCYIPFAAGPRTCIGAGMAMLEIQLVVANLLRRFVLRPLPGHPIVPAAKVTLTPKFGMPVTVSPRR